MKKMIYQFMAITLVGSFVCNTFAAKGKNGSNDNGGNGSNRYNNSKITLQNITAAQFLNVADQRSKNPNQDKNKDPIYLSLKKKARTQAEKESPQYSTFQINPSHADSDNYGTITDEKTGLSFVLKKSSPEDIRESSPSRIGHSEALWNATTHTFHPKNIVLEGLPFYMAVGANHVIDLLKDYEKNPMALEMFVEELKHPLSYLSLFSFMVGNRYAQTIMESRIKIQREQEKLLGKTPSRTTRAYRATVPFLSMIVGALASNISSDLMTITKPCADAIFHSGKEEYNSVEKVLLKCDEGFDAVITSDNLARYVTSTASTFLAALAGSTAEGLIATGFKKGIKIPIESIVFLIKKAKSAFLKAPLATAAEVGEVIPTPSRFGIKAFGNIILFFQADSIISPYVHYGVEALGNSSPKLYSTINDTNAFLKKLESTKWEDWEDYTAIGKVCHQTVTDITNNRKEYLPAWIEKESQTCTDGYVGNRGMDSLFKLHEKYQKWREALSNEFMTNYSNWVRFIAEFTVMHEVSNKYFEDLLSGIASKDEDIRTDSSYYNPFAFDNPFFGISPSDSVQIDDPLKFKLANKSKAQRILESLPLVEAALTSVVPKSAEYDNLYAIKKYIGIYEKYPTEINQKYLLTAIELINKMDKEARSLSAAAKSGRDRYTIAAENKIRSQSINSSAKIMAIRTYLGNPTPLKKGAEAFIKTFNDYVKTEKPDYVELFNEKGTPAETITWYAVCGNTLEGENARVDKRRVGFATAIDSGINGLFAADNAVADKADGMVDWLLSKVGVKIDRSKEYRLRTDLAPTLKIFDAINYGTGVDFYVPKVVTGSMQRYCQSAGKDTSLLSHLPHPGPDRPAIYPIVPEKGFFKLPIKGDDGKSYDSLFSYMIEHIKPEVLLASKNEKGQITSSGFAKWWQAVIIPKIALAHEGFMEGYYKLLDTTYRKAIDGGIGRSDPELTGLDKILNQNRASWGSAANVTQSFSDEMNTYLKILDRAYTMTPETKKTAADLKLFKGKIVQTKAAFYDLLNDYRNFNTRGGIYIPDQYGRLYLSVLAEPRPVLQEKYAKLLFEIRGVYKALGFVSEKDDEQTLAAAAGKETPYLKNRKGEENLAPMERLMARLNNDATISAPFNQIVDSSNKNIREAIPLTYGLTNANFKVQMSGNQVQSVELINFESNDRLSVAYAASNQLFAVAEELYQTISLLDAATVGANFKNIDMYKQPKKGILKL